MDMRAVILAAGRGTRLGELVRETPKPMLLAGGQPLIAWIIANLRRSGIERIAVNVHYQAAELIEWLGDGRRHGLRELVISREEELLGTAGALRPLAKWLEGCPFLVHYGDVVSDQDLGALVTDQQGTQAAATILVHRRSGSNSVVELADNGWVKAFHERPTAEVMAAAGTCWVNSGIAMCSPDILAHVPALGPADLPRDIFPTLAEVKRLRALPLSGYRMAVDSPQRLASLEQDIMAGRLHLTPGYGTINA